MVNHKKKGISLSYVVEKRLKFIEFNLFWEGKINRGNLMDFFNISVPQASLDIQKYQTLAPGNMDYDKSGKYYYATDKFKPIIINPTAESYFRYLKRASQENTPGIVDRIPQFDSVPLPGRRVDPEILRAILSAIRNMKSVEINYQSMSRPEPINRWIIPKTLGFDGFRWHLRAFCEMREDFRDFLFSRILSVSNEMELGMDVPEDKKWNEFITLKIGPNPALEHGPRKVIEYDYGMKDGCVPLTTRIALAYYLLKRLGIDNKKNIKNPKEQQIVLLNQDEVFSILG